MEAERKAGYPVKTHALAMQYQAWIDLVIADKTIGRELLSTTEAQDLAHHVSTLHCYPVARRYTFNYGGRPTVVGLRGYPVHDAIQGLGGRNQLEPSLLAWMYGASAGGGLIELDAT